MRKHLLLTIALLCAVVQGAWAQTEVSSESALTTALSGTSPINIKLTADITLSNYVNISDSKTVTIDLNGNKLNRGLSSLTSLGNVIRVQTGSTLTIKDSKGDNSGKITGGYDSDGGGICIYGTVNFEGGTITGCQATNGGAVYVVAGGSFTMTGGVITGNTASYCGGVIYNKGTFNFNSGTVSGSAPYGGAVYNTGSFTMAGGTISNSSSTTGGGGGLVNIGTVNISSGTFTNNTAQTDGGAIWNGNSGSAHGTLTITGGTITTNTAKNYGGGIWNENEVTISNCEISSNTGDDGGGIYNKADGNMTINSVTTFSGNKSLNHSGGAINNHGKLTVNGGSFTSNTAKNYGGAIGNFDSGVLTINGGSFTGNSVTSYYGGGVYIGSGTFNLSGSVNITSNTANSKTDNLYLYSDNIINVKGALTGSSIGVTLEGYNRDFTSGFRSKNSGAQPSDLFSSDVNYATLSLNGNEAKLTITSGLTYIERVWEGGNTDGQVVSKTKRCDSYTTYNGEKELYSGWYLLSGSHSYDFRLVVHGPNTYFILEDGSNIEFKKGIHIDNPQHLTIYGQSGGTGKLRATGSGNNANAAIGGNEDQMSGSLVIHGGTIEASSSENNAAAIGGGDGSSSGMNSVIIYGGTVTATGKSSGAGIGGGQENNTVPSVTIYGGTINATGGNYAAGIGGSEESTAGTVTIYGGTITATGGKDGAGIGGGENGDCGKVYIYGGEVTASSNDYGAGIGGGENGDNGTVYIYGGTVKATGGSYAAGIGGGKSGGGGTVYIYGGDVTAKGGNYGVGIGGDDLTIKIYGGKIHATGRSGSDDSSGPGVGVMNGDGKLYFTMDDGELTADVNQEGISSRDPDCGAGIGGHSKTNVELHVTINGGTINTTGGDKGAGIGASGGTSGGTINSGSEITINGGTVNATGGKGGAGIGSGYAGNQKGTITINGGTVNATGGKHKTGSYEGNAGAGIGGGGEQNSASTGGNGGTIIINGGKVTAKPGESDSGASHPAQAIGHGEADENSGSLTLGNNVSVRDNYGNKFTSENRITECRHHSERVVEVCEHSEKNCTPDGDSGHTINCSYCLKTGSESHNFDTDGHTCKSCGYVMTDLKTITIYEANSAGTGYNSTPTTYSVQYNTTFTLPECSSVPNNMWFVGWKETTDAPSSFEAESSEFSSLKAAGTEITVTDDVTYYARYHTTVWPGGGNGTAGDPYLISTEEDWNEFVNAVSYKNFDFGGRYLKLTENISVTEMVGTSSNRFRGTFDGDGHTLTVSYTTGEQYTAPFRYVDGATIQNLKVAGTITPSAKFAGGIVGSAKSTNTITNCVVDVTINSQVNGDGTHGGIVANINNGTTTISGCVFKGSLLNNSTTGWGGFVGWTESDNSTTVSIANSLFIPTTVEGTNGATNGATFARYRKSNSVTITDCYYTSTLGDAQGTQAYTVTNGQPSDMTLDYGSGNNYGYITAYTFDQGNDATASGLLYDDVLYTGGTTKVTFTPEAKYSFTAVKANGTELTANSDGTYTLTMNNANVTIEAPESDYAVTLYDGTNDPTNSATIAKNSGRKANVTISGRTLYKDGTWNTLCLPFDVTAVQIAHEDHPLYGATIMEMDAENSGFEASTGKVSVTFKAATKIEARKPYIVKWATMGTDIVDPTFLGSTIDDDSPKTVESADGVVSFTGNYDPLTSTDGLLFDSHNTDNRSFHAALEVVGYAVNGWYTDAGKTESAASIPFGSDDGAVTLYTTFKKLLSNQDITITIATQTWTGNAIEPAVTVMDGDTDITEWCEFAYSDNTDVGTATVTVTAKSESANYAGSTTASFTIAYYQATLYSDADNTAELTNITNKPSGKADVTLSGITLKRTKNAVQTICLPFDLDSFTDTPLDGFTVQTPTSGEEKPDDATTYVVKCSETTYIVAHQPYILKWTQSAKSDIENPKFEDVTIESVTPVEVKLGDNDVSLCGTYAPKTITASGSYYFVTADGNVSNAGGTVNAMEVYIHNDKSGTYTQIVIGGDTPITPTTWTGSGTESDPYLITSIADLDALSNYVRDHYTFSGKHFKMTKDIDYSGKNVTDGHNFMPIGNTYYRFSGTFDGDCHSISGIRIETGYEDQGVFGFVDNNGTVKNLTLTNSTIKAAGEVGGIAGRSRGTIENCHVTSSVTITVLQSGTSGFGGIVGTSYGTISGCTSAASVGATDEYYIGGIAGYLSGSNAKMKNCLYIGNSVVGSGYVGALCGSKGSNASLTRNFYKPWDGCPGAVNGGDTDGAKPGYTVESGTEGLTLDYGSATTTYEYDGIKAYSFDQGNDQTAGGLLYQSMLYTGGTTKVTFTPKASNGQQPTALAASNGETITNNSNGTWTLTMNSADVTVTATAYSNYDVMLYDDSHSPTNTTTLQEYNGLKADVTISGRTLYKDDSWNTICLPFDMTAEQVNVQLNPLELKELDVDGKYDGSGNPDNANGTYQTGFDDGTLYLYFKSTTEGIKAGKPYIIKWAYDDDIVNPSFSGVTINSNDPEAITSADGNVSFVGNYDPVYTDEDGDATKLYLGAGNKLYYPSSIRAINAFRAYFQLNNGITAGEPKSGQQHVRAFYLNFGGDEETTGITTTNYTNFTNSAGAGWYDMQGRKLQGRPTKKGIYINNGKKQVIK